MHRDSEIGTEKLWTNARLRWALDRDEVANTITHGLGFFLSVVGASVMAAWVVPTGEPWRIAGCMVFATMLVTVYAMSTMSHACTTPKWKCFFEVLDQAFIYLLIVGTFTPFALAYSDSRTGWVLLSVMWIIALFGFVSKLAKGSRIDKSSVWLHLLLGWLPLTMISTWLRAMPRAALWWVLIGGIFYTVGTIFLVFDRHVRHFHAMWHLLVIAGSASHYFVILLFIARS